jgi:hypothetical protein
MQQNEYGNGFRLFTTMRPLSLPVASAGDPNAQWAYFQEQKHVHINLRLRLSAGTMTDWNQPGTADGTVVEAKWPKFGPSKIVKNTRIGIASDFWNRYKEDIQLAKDIGEYALSAGLRYPQSLCTKGLHGCSMPVQCTTREKS